MTTETSRSSTTGLALIAGALVIGAFLLAGSARDIGRRNDALSVTGSARRAITADLGTWTGNLTVQRPDLAGGYTELTAHTARVRAWLRAQGYADSTVTVTPVTTQRLNVVNENGQETGQLAGYRLQQDVSVTLRDPRRIAKLAQDVSALIGEGIPLSASAPQYLFTRLGELRVQMMGEATADARARAEAIARGAGSAVGGIRSAETGVVQITPRFSTEVSDYGMNDVTSIEKDITTVVRVTFTLR